MPATALTGKRHSPDAEASTARAVRRRILPPQACPGGASDSSSELSAVAEIAVCLASSAPGGVISRPVPTPAAASSSLSLEPANTETRDVEIISAVRASCSTASSSGAVDAVSSDHSSAEIVHALGNSLPERVSEVAFIDGEDTPLLDDDLTFAELTETFAEEFAGDEEEEEDEGDEREEEEDEEDEEEEEDADGEEDAEEARTPELAALFTRVAELRQRVLELGGSELTPHLLRLRSLLQQVRSLHQGLDPEAIEANTLTMVLSSKPVMDNDVADAAQRQCMICLEDFEVNDRLRVLPCFHRYHCGCVDNWFSRSRCCPVCKHDVTARSEEAVLPTQTARHPHRSGAVEADTSVIEVIDDEEV